ncbi:S-layer homology domain-containing protein [Mitsuokella jalaludinii]|uniref:S-layer homology domain-containing protein n=1 Tax=Mitsuokella jalaludinii TaxID=187979 RepID=UPI00242FF6C4|nr:S-layer homology domain-containing protein [Mitsuokella jalaludinii]
MNTQAGSETGGQNSIAFGNYTQALGGRSVAFGEYTIANYNDSVAFGNDTRALSTGATAFGNRTRALSQYATAWGNATVAADEESTAWGSDTIAGAKLDENGAVTNNYKINPDDKNEPVKQEQMDVHGNLAYIQPNGKTAGIKQMPIDSGTEKHDYVVLAGKDGNTYIRDYQGSLWKVNVAADGTVTVDTTAGTKGKVYNGQKKTSLAKTTVDGSEVDINPDNVLTKAHEGSNGYTIDGYANATAFGYSTEASGDNATAFGNDTKASAAGATAFGYQTVASGDNATAFGENSTASGEAATAFGIGSSASGKNSLAALGGTASAENAAAIGNSAQATLADSVALGSNSKTTRAKYRDLTVEAEKAAYGKGTTSTGPAWEATDNAIAVGNDSTVTRQITGVAAGSLDTDAVNVAQLRAVDAKHTIVTVGGQSATADNTPVNGGNLDLKRTTATNGQETYDLSLDKNVTLGKQVENEGGKLTVNNVDKFKNYDENGNPLPDTTVKEAVKIDGKTVSVVKHDGSDADNDQRQVVLGVDQDAGGYVTLYDNTGKKPTYIYNAISDGITYLKDKDSYLTPDPTNPNDERASNEFNRLEYGDYHTSTIQFIATLDDGQKYAGDNYQAAETETKTVDGKTTKTVTKEEHNVLLKKLNERLDIKGGADKDKLTENNIGVNVDSTTGVMKVQLAQNLDLTDKGSVKMGNTTIKNGGVTITTKDGDKVTNTISLTDNGLNNGGKTITNIAGGTNPTDAVNVSQLNAAKTTVTSNDHSVAIDTTTDSTDNHKNYDLRIATATLSQDKTTGDNPVETGRVTVSNPKISVTENGETKQVDNPNAYVTGNSVADAINNSGFKLTASASEGAVTGNKETLIHPGDTVTIDAGKNISLTQDKGKISIATKDNLNLGSADSKDDKQQDVPGTNGSITVNGKNGSSVAINGQDGSIGLTGPKGTDGTSTSIQMSTIMSDPTLDDGKNTKTTSGEGEQQTTTTQAPRIQYKKGNTTYEVATMDDGQKYAGDVQASDAKANAFSRKLNEQTNIVGGVKNLDALSTGNNVGVVSNGTDTLTIRLAKELTDLTSVTTVTKDAKGNKTSETVQNGKGITIIPSTLGAGKTTVSLTDNGLSNGGNQITHVDSGLKDAAGHEVELKNATGDVLNNAVNVGDLKNVQNAVTSAHTAVTVNGSVEAPAVAADGKLGNYTDKEKGNLLLAQKKDTTTGKITYDLKLNDNVILGKDTSDGKDGQEGTIGLTGKDGLPGTDGKQGYRTTIIKTEKGQKGKDGKTGKENLGGTDITRIVYTDKDGSNPQTVATLSDGLKFAGDDISKTVDKKLNDTLQIRGDGTYDKEKNTIADDGNIKTSVDNGAVKVSLSDTINLHQAGSLTVGGDKKDGSKTVDDPIVIKHFDDKTLDVITGVDENGKLITAKEGKAGDYVTGLDNKAWDVSNPTYVSGRAATEDQLKTISDAVNKAASTAGKHTVVTVNDKDSSETTATVGTNGKYGAYSDSTKGNLLIASKDENGKTTYNIKLNDQLAIGKKGTPGQDGKDGTDGKFTVETSKGTTVVIGHDGKDGKDGISVKGNDGKDGVTIGVTNGKDGKDGSEGHIGLTGPVSKDGKDASADIHVKNGQNGVDGTDGNNGKDGMDRIVYEDHNHITHEVATMDDGLQIGANAAAKENAANPVSNKLNSTINIKGSDAKANHTYTDDNLTTTVEQDVDGNTTVKVLMDKDITGNSVTVGKDSKDGEAGKDGYDGQEGSIGIAGKNGINGKDGKQGITTTIITTEKGQNGKDGEVGKQGAPGVDGKDITRIVYKNGQDGENGQGGKHVVATLDDGLNFVGDDSKAKPVAKKLNDTLQIRGDGTYDEKTKKSNGNIQTSVEGGTIKVALNDKINLHQDGSLTVGGNKNGDAADGNDPILIKHFDENTLDVITVVDKDGNTTTAKANKAGDYVTGLDNKDWNVDKPEYVSGRAATEDQLKTISDAVKEAATTAGKHTAVTVEGGKPAGTSDYSGENLKLKVTDTNGQKTYDLKLNDNLNLGTVGKDGAKGTDGSVGLKGADGKSSIGLNGKDGISVIGKDGQNGVSITGSNGLNGKDGIDGKIAIGTPGKDGQPGKDAVSISGQDGEGHIGLTGPKGPKGADGKDGQNASADIHVKNGQVGVDGTDGHGGKDGMDRVVYEDHNGVTHEVATMDDGQKYAGDFGDGASVKLNKTVTIKGNVAAGKTKDDFVDGNIAVVANKNGEDGELLLKLNKDLTGLNSSSYATTTRVDGKDVTSKTVVDGTGLKIDNGPSITNTGIDGGKHQITNVASGKDGKMYDTTVEGQENWNNAANIGDVTNIAKSAADGVQAKSGKNITVDDNNKVNLNDHITLGDAANKAKQVDIDGNGAKITAGDGNNKVTVDGSKGQIIAGGDNGVKIGNIAGGDRSLTIYDKDGNATNQTDKAGKYVTNLGNKTWNKDGSYVSGRAATEDQLHQVESNVNKQIADVNTKIDEVDKHHTEVTVNGGTAAKADGSYTDGNLQLKQTTGEDGQKVYDLKLNDQLKVGQKGDAGKAGKDGNVTVETKGGTTVVIGHDGKDGKDGRDGLFVTGKDGKNGKSGVSITGPNGVAGRDGVDGKVGIAGKDGRDAVSIAGRDGVGHIGLTGPKGADGKDGAFTDLSTILGQATLDYAKNVKGKDGDAKDEKASRIHYETTAATKDGEKIVSHEVATMDDGMKYSGDSGSVAVKLNNNVQLYGGAKEYAAGDNIGVVVSQDGDNAKMQVKLAKDLKGIDSIDAKTVTTGNTTINNGGLTVKGDDKHKDITVQQGAVNMGGNKVENVAPGRIAPDSTDAVNGSQLAQRDQAIGKLGGEVSSLDRRVDRVGAGAAALAALHPQNFDPDDKWDFAVGYGNYRGANAAAVGAFYRPNEDTTLSVGGTVGGGENMVNTGISFKFGQGNHVTNSRVAMAKEILALKDYVQKQDEKIEKLEALVGQQGTANAPKRRSILFPDVPENHWAYVYVKKLADRGLLEGYPDGEFKGTRTITRYEFAAIFSRALENGASVDGDMERMSEEFEPEIRELSLTRFRVDRVEGDDNDRHKIERVRVNDRDELVKQKNGEQKKRYRDVYGSVIEKDAPSDAVK